MFSIRQMAAANKVAKLIVGQGGFLSTPAVSNLIRNNMGHVNFDCNTYHIPSPRYLVSVFWIRIRGFSGFGSMVLKKI